MNPSDEVKNLLDIYGSPSFSAKKRLQKHSLWKESPKIDLPNLPKMDLRFGLSLPSFNLNTKEWFDISKKKLLLKILLICIAVKFFFQEFNVLKDFYGFKESVFFCLCLIGGGFGLYWSANELYRMFVKDRTKADTEA